MSIECGKSNATKVEVDKHILFNTMGKKNNPVVNNVKRHLLLGTSLYKPYCLEVYLLNQHYLQIWPAVKARSKGSQHDQKERS